MDRVHHECCLADSDQRLVEMARQGDAAAFEAIVLRYQKPLLRHCRRMLTAAEAEDAVQDAFLAAFRTIKRTEPDLRLGGWLFRIAHNAALGILRRRTLTMPLDRTAVEQPADEAALQRLQLRDTLAAISSLPESEQRALVERVLAGRGHREIAITLGRSEGAVRQLLHRARARLRDGLAVIAPLVLRLAPANGDQQFAGASLAAKSGLIIAVGVTAVGGGSAVLSRSLSERSLPVAGARPGVPAAMSPGWPSAVSGTVLRSVGQRSIVTGPSERAQGGRGGQSTRSASVRTRAATTPSRRSASGATVVNSTRSGPAGSRPSAQAATPTATATPAPVQASGQTATAPGQPATALGLPATAAGLPATAPGQSITEPGQSATAAGQSGTAPEFSSAAPGPSATAPGASGAAPGHSSASPGRSAIAPGRVAGARGQAVTTPGRSGRT